jgi:hypothetical protein
MDAKELIHDLVHGPAIVRALTHGIRQEEAIVKPDEESWSILEVVCHLFDEEREDFRRRLDIILHHPQEPWPPINPRGWVIERNYNGKILAEMLDAFEEERRISILWLESLEAPDWEREAVSPWGSMKAGEMFAAWAAHDKLHFRQLVELRYARVKSLAKPYDVQYAGDW